MSNVAKEGMVSLNDDLEKLVKTAEKLGEEHQRINLTQIRKFHGHITKIWSKYIYNKKAYSDPEKFKELRDEIRFMKIFLAYQAARKPELEALKRLLEPLIESINNPLDFEKFKKFYDAFLAYHKFYSEFGKQKK